MIGIDLLGSDTPPEELLASILERAPQLPPHLRFTLFGMEELFSSTLKVDSSRFLFHPVKEFIAIDEPPLEALRKKKESSLAVGLRQLKEGQIQAFISAGNTGALMGSAQWQLPLLPNVERPALLTLVPTRKGELAVIDVGANTTCRTQYLLQYAAMGAAYQKSRGIALPKVGLLNIGCESCKGTPELKTAYELLTRSQEENTTLFSFKGNVEARDVFHGDIDVLVTDGFTGNVFLKTAEGVAAFILEQIEETAHATGSSDLKLVCDAMRQHLHYDEYPGALLSGVDGIVIKCHGHCSMTSLMRSVAIASDLIQNNFLEQIKKVLCD
jgi:glycerol-3-phosphate acyltransferase PlsX